MDSSENDEFVVHLRCGRVSRFQQTQNSFYASRLFTPGGSPRSVTLAIATVEGNKENFTKRVARDAKRARRLQIELMFPSDRHLKTVAESLHNCPILPKDVENANTIFGPALGGLKVKTKRSRSVPVVIEVERMPQEVSNRFKKLHLHADIYFVNGIDFVVSITDQPKFCTFEAVGKRTDEALVVALKNVHDTYIQGGFRIGVVSLSGEFTSAADNIHNKA